MQRLLTVLAGAALVTPAFSAFGDADRGRELFKAQRCVTCHSVAGEGGKSAPDLARIAGRAASPAGIASEMWNHAPAMWAAIEKSGAARPQLATEDAQDLFAYFQAGRAFEQTGDPARGRKTFVDKGCAQCHNLSSSNSGGGPPVTKWESVADPIELARQMWNHTATMQAAIKGKNLKLPQLTAVEMNDITTYLRSLPQMKGLKPQLSTASAETGEKLFTAKGCAGCHTGANSLPRKGAPLLASEFAASMWNHAGSMKQIGELRPEEMKRLAGYLWSKQYADEGGDKARGEKAWKSKGCAGCHGASPPYLAHGEETSSFGMIAIIWRHGPEMLKQMKAKNIAWPRFEKTDLPDVVAYVKSAL